MGRGSKNPPSAPSRGPVDASVIEEIKERLTLSEIVGKRVVFDRTKSRPAHQDYWACCPFHHETTPSFHVLDRQGMYKCFGCGATGDHFTFVQETQNLSFGEALETLARDAGVALPKADPAVQQKIDHNARLREINEQAARFFAAELSGPSQGAREARAHLERRGITSDEQSHFRLGVAPRQQKALLKALENAGFKKDELVASGVFGADKENGRLYPRFRDRLIFPITDRRGRVIAFGGRRLEEDQGPKYLNSSETPVFKKRETLYNLAHAREALAKPDRPLLVAEGYTDVIALTRAGFPACVAPLGTAASEEHLAILWKLHKQPIFCFDGDGAGRKAARALSERALPGLAAGQTVQLLTLPQGEDPDDFLKRRGAEAFGALLKQAEPLVSFLFRTEWQTSDTRTPEGRAALEASLEALAERIGDKKISWEYKKEFRSRAREAFFQARMAGRGGKGRGKSKTYQAGKGYEVPEPLRPETLAWQRGDREALICASLFHHPVLLEDFHEALAETTFQDQTLDNCRQALVDAYGLADCLETVAVETHVLDAGGPDLVAGLKSYGTHPALSGGDPTSVAGLIEEMLRRQQVSVIEAELAALTEEFNQYKTPTLWERLRALRDEVKRLKSGESDAYRGSL